MAIRSVLGKMGRRSCIHCLTSRGQGVDCPFLLPPTFRPVKVPPAVSRILTYVPVAVEDFNMLQDKTTPPMSCSMILDPQPRPVKVPLDDPEIVTAAREAIEDFNEDMGTHLRLVRVLEANEWFSPIRSRHYYYLTLEAADAGVVRVYKTEVVEGLQSMIPQSFHHVGDYKSVEA